jgi:hypothetical protein
MRRFVTFIGIAAGITLAAGPVGAAEPEVVQKQKEAAAAHWKQMFGDEAPATEETARFLIYAPSSTSARQLEDLGAALEKQAAAARGALKIGAKDGLWPGKLTVYLMADRRSFASFMRTVAKKRPTDEAGIFGLDDMPFVAASPPQQKYQPSLEGQAAEQVAAAMLAKKAGAAVPEWVVAGFGRATSWRANPGAHYQDRVQVRRLIRGHTAYDVWSDKITAAEAPYLRASLVEYLAYGPGAPQFPKFLEGFKPGDNQRMPTTMDALKAVRADYAEAVNRAWPAWAARSR